MSRPRRRNREGLWGRFVRWSKSNERVLVVMLLALLSVSFAFPQIFMPFERDAREAATEAVVFCEAVSRGEIAKIANRLETVFGLFPSLQSEVRLTLPFERRGAVNPLDFRIFVEEARRLGLRVTDAELGARRRELWRQRSGWLRAANRVRERGAEGGNPNQVWFEEYQKAQEALKDTFDVADWERQVAANRHGLPVPRVEEAIRDVVLVGKLERYVVSTVTVSPREVLEELRRQEERRHFSWVELEPGEGLEAQVVEKLTPKDLEEYFREHREDFQLPVRIRCDYLFVPREHFVKEADAAVTEEALEGAYREYRERYRKPGIRSHGMVFALRTPEETAEIEAETYKPFDEVKDEVREKWIADEARKRLGDFVAKLRLRLYPSEPREEGNRTLGGGKAATFAELAAEHDLLVSGTIPYTSEEEAEEAFGEYYDQSVKGWYRTAGKDGALSETQLKALETARPLGEKGSVFFANVEIDKAHQAELAEVEDRVREALVHSRLAGLLASAAEKRLQGSGEAGSEAAAPSLESLAGAELAVEEGDIEGVATFSKLRESGEYLANKAWVSVLVPKGAAEAQAKKDNAEDGESDGASGTDEEAAEWPPPLEAHPSSAALIAAAFEIGERGGLEVGRDEERGLAFVVRYDDGIAPDRNLFMAQRGSLRRRLLRERQEVYFAEWRQRLFEEALGGPIEVGGEKAGEPESAP